MVASEKIHCLRNRLGCSVDQLASLCKLSREQIYDLESHADELTGVLDLSTVERLCHILKCPIQVLLLDAENIRDGIDSFAYPKIVGKIKTYLFDNKLTIEEFEERCGWEIRDGLNNDTCASFWNVDCLIDICRTMNERWEAFVREVTAES